MKLLIKLKEWLVKACVYNFAISFSFFVLDMLFRASENNMNKGVLTLGQYALFFVFSFFIAVCAEIFKIEMISKVARLFIHFAVFGTGVILIFLFWNKAGRNIESWATDKIFVFIFLYAFLYFAVYGIAKLFKLFLAPAIKRVFSAEVTPTAKPAETKKKDNYQNRFQ